jgi:DNA-binding transcriptional ArsR family regulator
LVAKYFRAFGDPTRLHILQLLLRGERSVGELVDELAIAQSRVSNHLSCLRWCGLVTTRNDGRRVYYALADPRVAEMIRLAQSMVALHGERLASCAFIEE